MEDIKSILLKLQNVEKRKKLFESLECPSSNIGEYCVSDILDAIYDMAPRIAELICERYRDFNKDDVIDVIRITVVGKLKNEKEKNSEEESTDIADVKEAVSPMKLNYLTRNPKMKELFKKAYVAYDTMRDWNPRINPEQQARWAAEEFEIDPEVFIEYLRKNDLLK